MGTGHRTIALGTSVLVIAALCLAGLLVGPTGSADAAGRSERVGGAPALPRGAHRLGTLAPGTSLAVDITLAPRRPQALSAFATAVSTPHSADYHHYLSVGQFRRRFAPSAAEIAAVRRGLRAAGLTPGSVSANGLLIKLTAPAHQLARAFHTRLERVRLRSGRLTYANTSAPQFSTALAGLVQGVVGLNNLSTPHSLGIERAPKRTGRQLTIRRAEATVPGANAVTPCAAASTAAGAYGAYTADEIASVYGFSSLYAGGDQGAGQTVALMEFEPYLSSDIATFNGCYGINGASASDVSEINVDGGVGSSFAAHPDGTGEAVLDIEQILSLAPAAKVDVYEAPNSAQGDLDAYTDMVQNAAVKIISTSWGECERLTGSSLAKAENTIFQEAAAQGQSVYAAAGDAGSTDCASSTSHNASSLAVDDPGSQPYVTSVGGTKLPSDSDPSQQTTWNDSAEQLGAGGGGVSLEWTMPSYQTNASSALGLINADSSTSTCAANTGSSGADCREVPDVSADADPETGYVVYFSGDNDGWSAVGGTSAAAPLWAAMTALANASSYCGPVSIGFANPILYGVAGNAGDYGADFTDVTVGNTDYTDSGYQGGLFPATAAYDMATGLGTPRAATLVPAMCVAAGGPGTAPATIASTSLGSVSSGSISPASGGSVPAASGTGSPSPSQRAGAGGSGASSPAADTSTLSSVTWVSTGTTQPTACRRTTLRAGAATLALSAHRGTASMSVPLDLPTGCESYELTLARHITTSEHRAVRGLDTLRIQVLSRTGRVLGTLATLSSTEAAPGDQTLRLDLARYAGRKLTLRFLAVRRGVKATAFTLRSVALKLS